jgi:hypothetical protein
MERRKSSQSKTAPLPLDYVKMVNQVLTTTFDEGLKKLNQLSPKNPSVFFTTGRIFSDEIVLAVSLIQQGRLPATTVFASVDFDPKASAPTVEDLLGACVDTVGSLFSEFFSPKHPARLEQMLSESLSALDNAPFEWTAIKLEKYKVHLKMDKSNPVVDSMADDFLSKHDPSFKEREREEAEETEKLFVTGKKSTH